VSESLGFFLMFWTWAWKSARDMLSTASLDKSSMENYLSCRSTILRSIVEVRDDKLNLGTGVGAILGFSTCMGFLCFYPARLARAESL